jgi:hypothetical protein
MYEQATIAVVNVEAFGRIQQGLKGIFTPARSEWFLEQVVKSKCRVREFERVLQRGLLGVQAQADYAALPDSDKAQVREMYLRLVEQVASPLREKFSKVYAYY